MIRGRIWTFGDHVDTDVIIPARYCGSYRADELGPHAMSGIDPNFAGRVAAGDIIVAGGNFGCGSSRENAPLALLGAGIGAVVALSFGRIFFRNAVNVGLPVFVSEEAPGSCGEGQILAIDPEGGVLRLEETDLTFQIAPYPKRVREIIECGGMVNYVRRRLGEY